LVEQVEPAKLTDNDFGTCIAIIRAGGAVNLKSAQRELRIAAALAIARHGDRIVGVGAIKRSRPEYAAAIAYKSGATFPSETLELGYVAVEASHRRHGLSERLVSTLLAGQSGPLFATTSSDAMKRTLRSANFAQRGHEWKGSTSMLSLWLRR